MGSNKSGWLVGVVLLWAGAVATSAEAQQPGASQPLPIAAAPVAPLPAPAQESSGVPAVPPAAEAAALSPAEENAAAAGESDAEAQLALVQGFITLSEERIAALRQEVAAMGDDRNQHIAALAAAAQRVDQAEQDVRAMQATLQQLALSEREVRERMAGAQNQLDGLLSALQRISRSPPPAVIINPSDALGSARSASLLASLVPQLQARAGQVSADLDDLQAIRAAAVDQDVLLRTNLQILEEEQLRIATLMEARRRGVQIVGSELQTEEQAAQDMLQRAQTLRALVTELDARATAIATARQPTPGIPLSEEQIALALSNQGRTQPAFPFAQARGHLRPPANGVTVVQFGSNDGFGGISDGVSIVTRADADIVAPADGWVVHAGPFLNYGQIVVMNPGQGYTILLAGLESTSVEVGRFVRMGEPVGVMGAKAAGLAAASDAGASHPTLYMELRENNVPIDPIIWWTRPGDQTQSG